MPDNHESPLHGWGIMTCDYGVWTFNWDTKLHPKREDAERELELCRKGGYECRLIRMEVEPEEVGKMDEEPADPEVVADLMEALEKSLERDRNA